ncbi:hypothetical protein IW261DRAFT_150004 [Armillaria novae-zelandiae]|uniref:Secreted protein n=1 Tax=Armillaria novae-zelandiae TaxID=153914 RepID=A0AA39UEX8_9AGAR|nr:hypothetical protein IW261DRAFT_150004 [Armillaria novae-zelandiae]
MITLHPPFCIVLLAAAAEIPRVGSQQHGKTVCSYSDQTVTGTIDFCSLVRFVQDLVDGTRCYQYQCVPITFFCCGSHHEFLGLGRPSHSSPTLLSAAIRSA